MSGTVLVWGVLLVQLWPVLANIQTGRHLHAIILRGPSSPIVISYAFLKLGLALGMGMIGFGVIHVVGRGLWLTRFSLEAPPPSDLPERISRRAYVILHVYWLLVAVSAAIVAPIALLMNVVERTFVTTFHVSLTVAQVISGFVPPLVLIAVVLLLRWRRESFAELLDGIFEGVKDHFRRFRLSNYIIAYSALIALALVANEFCYVATISAEHHVYERSRNVYINVFVELGGATSSAEEALLIVGGPVRMKLPLRSVGNGMYVGTVATRTLPLGEYTADLVYHHPSVTALFPFFQTTIQRRTGFVLLP